MIKNFETVKEQLGELAGVVNSFKSEAVQLRIVELIFGMSPEEEVQVDNSREDIKTKPKKIKRKKFNGLNLSPIHQREVLTITAVLRIAVGLDDSRSQATEIKHIESNREKILMVVEGPEALTDVEAAQRQDWATLQRSHVP